MLSPWAVFTPLEACGLGVFLRRKRILLEVPRIPWEPDKVGGFPECRVQKSRGSSLGPVTIAGVTLVSWLGWGMQSATQ